MKIIHDLKTTSLRAAALLAALSVTATAYAATEGEVKDTDKKVIKTTASPKVAKATTTVVKPVDEPKEEVLPLTASVTVGTSVGLGTFVSGPQQRAQVSTAITPTLRYKLSDKLSLSAAIGGAIYHLNDYSTSLYNGQFLFGDLYATLSHSSIYKHDASGFNLSAALRLYFPTSLASRFQNRITSVRPSFTGSIKAGPVTFSLTTMFMKYFNTSTSPSINCEGSFDPDLCIEGRGPGVGGGFESEIRGGEVFLPSAGISSFYVGNSLAASWSILDGLSLGASATVYNLFGYRSFDIGEFSSENAKPGRSQTDRLITSVSVSYQINKQLRGTLDFTTDTIRPFGADGNDLVVLDVTRASDNISAIGLSFAGTL